MGMSLDALERCARYGLPPEDGLATQYLICETERMDRVPGMATLEVNQWSVHYGRDVPAFLLRDSRDRPFGAFIGIGVDGEGNAVDASSFAEFNSKGLSFDRKFESFVTRIAGRFALLLDAGSRVRLYLDPMGHMATFLNPSTRLAGSSVFLTLDHAFDPKDQPLTAGTDLISSLPLGLTPARAVRLMPGNHLLNLEQFTLRRTWPLRNTMRPVTEAQSAPVIAAMADRLCQVVGGLVQDGPCLVEMDGSDSARQLLAATAGLRDGLAQVYGYERAGQDSAGPAHLCQAAGVPFEALTRDAALAAFGRDRAGKQQRKRAFWLRTGCLCRVPAETAVNLSGLRKPARAVLRADGAEAFGALPGPSPVSADTAIAFASGRGRTDDQDLPTLSDAYDAWRSGLGKTLQDRASDLIAMEWHQPARAVGLYGHEGPFLVSPFSDRVLMELALRLPQGVRVGPELADAMVAACDPALVGVTGAAAEPLATAAE